MTRIRYTTKMSSSSCSCSRWCCLLILQIMTVKITHYTGLHIYRHLETCCSRFLQSYSSYSICVLNIVVLVIVVDVLEHLSFVYFTGQQCVYVLLEILHISFGSYNHWVKLLCYLTLILCFRLIDFSFCISVYNCCLTPTERYPEKWGHTNFLVDFGKN